MERQAKRDIEQRVVDFWNANHAFAGGESAQDYINRLQDFISGPPVRDAAAEDAALTAIGAKLIK